jgi:hypothetical protein
LLTGNASLKLDTRSASDNDLTPKSAASLAQW